jgi:CRP-like cAMP-binding protein
MHGQLLEAEEYSSRASQPRFARPRPAVLAQGRAGGGGNGAIQPDIPLQSLRSLKPFHGFSPEECAEILAIARARSARKGDVLFTESRPGDACYVVVNGAVDVSFDGSEKLLARLGPSSIFGQVALIDGGRSNGTCTVQQDTLLLEMKHDACYRLLALHSPLAYKFLAALTDGVIHALRGAERQLSRLSSRNHGGSSRRR